ncbi:ferric reductase transmembrane component 4 [[Candida] railenensis]|uniref:Ferric reductase transmembrane component 4 n=1 Tax=[Candida] railenensis TaxID=45579 RepID=A0A9P0QSU1_9ASCO|nr:ferric reductase transmembrane component 4 [[Candida] railenensis]
MKVAGIKYFALALSFANLALAKTLSPRSSSYYVDTHGAYAPYVANNYDMLSCALQISSTVTFCTSSSYDCFCGNEYALATMVGCIHYGKGSKFHVSHALKKKCKATGYDLSNDDMADAYYNYTTYGKTKAEIPGFSIAAITTVPFILNGTQTMLYRKTYGHYMRNLDNSLFYGSGMIAFWVVIFFLEATSFWSKKLFPRLVKKFTGPISMYWRKYVTLPATLQRKRHQPMTVFGIPYGMMPSRKESIVVFFWIALVFFCNSHDIYYTVGDVTLTSKRVAYLKYITDRSGITGTTLMPLLILFSARNNFFSSVTGINYNSFMVYHRWVSRIAFILIAVHSLTYYLYYLEQWSYYRQQRYMQYGIAGTLAMGVMCIQGFMYLRRNWYEIFLFVHIGLGCVAIAGGWIHVDTLGYKWFYYAATAVWCFDRGIRIIRLALFGVRKAEVTLMANETIRVVVKKPFYWPMIPGGHGFIYFFRPTYCWQSHPFTYVESFNQNTLGSIEMYMKVKGGMTHSLYKLLSKAPNKSKSIWVSIEGPYGETTPASRYDTAVFIAGGNGIPGIFHEAGALADPESKQRIHLHWVIPNLKTLSWFYEPLKALRNTNIEATIHITRPHDLDGLEEFEGLVEDDESGTEKKGSDSESFVTESAIVYRIQSSLPHVKFSFTKPDTDALVNDEIAEAPGSICFVSCCNPIMVDDIRYACCNALPANIGKRIDYFEQLQVWA